MLREFATGVHLPETQNLIPPPHNVPIPYIYSILYCIGRYFLHTEGGRGREMNQKESLRSNSSQSWVENTNND
jgi:hypothetical protein